MRDRKDAQGQPNIAGQAARWLARMEAGDFGPADLEAMTTWLEASPDHRAAFDRVEAAWIAAGEVARETPGPVEASVIAFPRPARRPSARRWAVPALVAACVALVAVLPVYRLAMAPQVFETARGETRHITLADGTQVWLNSASRLSVKLTRGERRTNLQDGEAWFDVAKDASRPFTIAAGDRRVRVVGTAFNVLHDDARLVVTVQRGTVAVEPTAGGGRTSVLHAGDELRHEASDGADEIRRVDPALSSAWRGGRLIYQDRPLSEVAADLNRYLPTPLRVNGSARDLKASMVLEIGPEDVVVRRLQAYLPVTASRGRDEIVLSRRAP